MQKYNFSFKNQKLFSKKDKNKYQNAICILHFVTSIARI